MSADTQTSMPSKSALWTGRVLSALIVLFLFFNGVFGLTQPAQMKQGMAHMGYPEGTGLGILITMLTCAAIYAIPQTAVFGAILLTGYLGGATASHIRIGEQPTMAIVVGVLVWIALFLRDTRLRALVPIRS